MRSTSHPPLTHKFDTALPSLIEDLEGPSADFELPLNSLAYAIVIDVTLNPAWQGIVDRADQSVGFWPWFTFDGPTGKSPRPRVRQDAFGCKVKIECVTHNGLVRRGSLAPRFLCKGI